MRASLKMDFQTPDGRSASCRAELSYAKLEENLLLKGYNEKNEPLFVFKTNDIDFQLYLVHDNAVYEGSIFDLEDSPEIHSHLKALDLFRALKPLLFREDKTALEKSPLGETHLIITGNHGLEREIFASKTGDVLRELYYGRDGKMRTEIIRGDPKIIPLSKKEKFVFPYRITVRNPGRDPESFYQTELLFESTDFTPFDENILEFNVPEDVRRVDAGEDFKKRKALAG